LASISSSLSRSRVPAGRTRSTKTFSPRTICSQRRCAAGRTGRDRERWGRPRRPGL
jgi:hypothetical protein